MFYHSRMAKRKRALRLALRSIGWYEARDREIDLKNRRDV